MFNKFKSGFLLFAVVALLLIGSVGSVSGQSLSGLSDIGGHQYEDIIDLLVDEGIISGYPDGSYKPEKDVNRVEFLQVTVGSTNDVIPSRGDDETCGFSDTIPGEWYIPSLCLAVEEGIVSGYADGTFRPNDTINFVEAAKIVSLAYGFDISGDVGEMWYREFVNFASNNLMIPPDVTKLDQDLSRGQMAEFLGRYFLNKSGALLGHLQDQEMDAVTFDELGNKLDTVAWADVDLTVIGTGQGGISPVVANLVDFSKIESPLILTGEGYDGEVSTDGETIEFFLNGQFDNGLTLDVAADDKETDVGLSGSWGDFVSVMNVTLEHPVAVITLGADTPYDFSFGFDKDGLAVDWEGLNPSADQGLLTTVEWTGPAGEYSAINGDTMSFSLGDDSEISRFFDEFIYTPSDGPIENWVWQSDDDTTIINQVIKNDYFTEFLGFAPTDEMLFTLIHDQDSVNEVFNFTPEGSDFIMNMIIADYDVSETFVYSTPTMLVDMDIQNSGDLDGTISAVDELSGDSVEVSINDNVFDAMTVVIEDDDRVVQVDYDMATDTLAGYLLEADGTYQLFDGGGMLSHGVELRTSEFDINSNEIIIESDLVNLIYTAETQDVELTWNLTEGFASQQGNLILGSQLDFFSFNSEFGDEDAYNNADAADEDFEWFKKHELSLDPQKLIKGDQSGGVKGHDMKKEWAFGFDTEDFDLAQKFELDKDGLDKDFEAEISLRERFLRQSLKLKGKYQGVDVDADVDVEVEDDVLTGSGTISLSGGIFDADVDIAFGSGEKLDLGGRIELTPPSVDGMTAGSDFDYDGDDLTVNPFVNMPLYEGHGVEVDLELSGRFGTDGTASGAADVNVHDRNTGLTLGLGGTLGEGGDLGGTVSLGWGVSF